AGLQTLTLPHQEAAFDISFFYTNPQPVYTLAKSLHPGQFTPTVAHAFISLSEKKKLLHKCFTQNIDTLEHAAGALPKWPVKACWSPGWYTGGSCASIVSCIPG
ncbi:hypothetical protein HOY80DRAFT_889984, partial [Tuber brumale]